MTERAPDEGDDRPDVGERVPGGREKPQTLGRESPMEERAGRGREAAQ